MAKSELRLEAMDLTQLQGLQAVLMGLIHRRRKEQARKEGRTFARLKDIPSPEGHTHKFRFVEYLGDFRLKGDPARYECECGGRAYSCDNCGYVPGEPRGGRFDTRSPSDGRGSFGTQEVCIVCEEVLGRETFGHSD